MKKHLTRAMLSVGLLVPYTARSSDLPPWLTERRIIGHNDLEPIEKTANTAAYEMTRIVARVETAADGEGFCTGSRVGPDLFLTNYHCAEFQECDGLQFHLGYEKALAEADQVYFKCTALLSKSLTYDYALFRVEFDATAHGRHATAERTATPDDYPIATLWTGDITVGQMLLVAGHPAARLKEIDRGKDCKLRTIVTEPVSDRQTITHTCDTEGGSSGSPVLDRETGHVVALHWGGTDEYNMAIPIAKVVEDIEKNAGLEVVHELRLER